MPFVAYQPASSCRSAGPGGNALMYWLDRESPWARTLSNYGVHVCRLPSIHSEGRAGDSGVPVVSGGHPVGHAVVDFLARNGHKLGVQETIFARSRRSAAYPNGRYYTGVSPHYDHVHWSISHHAARYLNVPTIRAVAAGAFGNPGIPTTPAPDESVSPEEDDVYYIISDDPPNARRIFAVSPSGGWFEHLTGPQWNARSFFHGAEAKPIKARDFMVYVDRMGLRDVKKAVLR